RREGPLPTPSLVNTRSDSASPACLPRLFAPTTTQWYAKGPVVAQSLSPAASLTTPSMFFRLRYSPFLAQMVVIRRCNLSCGYCSEYDKVSEPVPVEILEERLRKLKALGTFGIS